MSKEENILNIYIIVSTEFEKDRLKYLTSYFESNPCPPNLKINYFEAYYFNRDEGKIDRNHYGPKLPIGPIMLSHTYEKLFEEILSKNLEDVVILESDVMFQPNFYSNLDMIYKEWINIASHPSVVFLGNGCNLVPRQETRISQNLYETNSTKCTDSMIFDRKSIEIIYKNMINMVIEKPVDYLWNTFVGIENLKLYWIDRPIVHQGSQNGTYASRVG